MAAIDPTAVIARTSLILGSPDSPMERLVRSLLDGAVTGELFTDDIRARCTSRTSPRRCSSWAVPMPPASATWRGQMR